MWIYACLVIVRLVWAALPQNGYIHPDEFFQSVEVTAGDALNISVERTWEFGDEFPLRSMVINNVLFAPVFYMLDYLTSTLHLFTLTGRLVVSSSRIVMVVLSFLLDYNVWRICRLWKLNAYTGVVVLSGSYVMLTYQTHSFSNSIESVLLVMVIGRIIDCVQRGEIVKRGNRVNERNDRRNIDIGVLDEDVQAEGKHVKGTKLMKGSNETVRRRKKNEDTRLKEGQSPQSSKVKRKIKTMRQELSTDTFEKDMTLNVTLTDCLILGFVNTLGIFNRPTFALFSITPFIWWCYRMKNDRIYLVTRVSLFMLISLMTSALICILDTCYYKGLTLSEMFNGQTPMTKLVLTPWNFVKYNTNVENLELHGKHPFFLHSLVNLPLLFGPLAFLIFRSMITSMVKLVIYLKNCCFGKKRDDSSFDKSSLDVSRTMHPQTFLLLWFIMVPVILLSLFPHQEPRFLVPLLPIVVIYSLQSPTVFKNTFVTCFILFNISLSLVYGVLHQGGVIPCLFKLQELSTMTEFSHSDTTVLFSHTYMPPRHILMLKNTSNMNIIDLKGGDLEMVQDLILNMKRERRFENGLTHNLLLAIPGSVYTDLKARLMPEIVLTVLKQFPIHLTLEDPPKIPANFAEIKTFFDELSLFLLKVT